MSSEGKTGAAAADRPDLTTVAGGRSRAFALAGICLGYALVILDANVLNVAAPVLRRDLGADPEGLLWAIDGYTLAFAALLLSAGALGDRLGVRRVFLGGLVVFLGASVACSLAAATRDLVIARVAQGMGAALLAPTSLALLRQLYTDLATRARALGIWAAVSGIAFALGPLCGGALVTYVGWRSIFLLNLPFCLAALALVSRHAPSEASSWDEGTQRAAPFDVVGQLIAVATLGDLTFALIQSTKLGWTALRVLCGFALAAGLAVVFVARERLKPDEERLLPMAAFRSGALRAGLLAGAAFNFGLYGTLFALTLHLQEARGLSPVLTGAAFLPLTALHAVVSAAVTGRLTAVRGPRVPLVAGLVFCSAGIVVLAAATVLAGSDNGPGDFALVIGLSLFGVGSGLTTTPMTALVLANTTGRSAGASSGLLNASRQIGGLVGVALLGSLTILHPAGPRLTAALAVAAAAMAGAALYGQRHIAAERVTASQVGDCLSRSISAHLGEWVSRHSERQSLLAYFASDHRIGRDMGLGFYEISLEYRKWPWQP